MVICLNRSSQIITDYGILLFAYQLGRNILKNAPQTISKNNQIFIQRYKIYLIYDFEKLKSIPDYENLGFTLKSLCKITQTALLAELSFSNNTEHNQWDLYNILQLLRSLIPEDELELLDKLNS